MRKGLNYSAWACAVGRGQLYPKSLLAHAVNLSLQPTLLSFSVSAGLLTGLLRDPDSKILSFDNLAMFDLGETKIDTKSKQRVPAYENMILPVSEWPTELFG